MRLGCKPFFVIYSYLQPEESLQMEYSSNEVREFRPADEIDPEFGRKLRQVV
jgi:hypothetical protein